MKNVKLCVIMIRTVEAFGIFLRETVGGGALENLCYVQSAEGARRFSPNLSGKRTEQAINMSCIVFSSRATEGFQWFLFFIF